MPNWNDIINGLTSPMVPKSTISGIQNQLAPGSGDVDIEGGVMDLPAAIMDILGSGVENPGATLGGFASGALEGARRFTSPLDALSMLPMAGAMGAAGKAAGQFGDDAVRMGRQAFDLVDDIPPAQAMPSFDDVAALGGDLQRNLAKIPSAGQRPPVGAPTPALGGNLPAEFVPRGGEAAWNAGQPDIDSIMEGFVKAKQLRQAPGAGNMGDAMSALRAGGGR